MESSLPLILGLVGGLLVLGVVAGAVVVLVLRKKKDTPARRWVAAAGACGLSPELGLVDRPGPVRVLGRRGSIDVVAEPQRGAGGEGVVSVRAGIHPPLRLGLGMYPEGDRAAAELSALLGAQDVVVGFPAIDEPFVIRAFEPSQVVAYFRAGASQPVLDAMGAIGRGWLLRVIDREVELVVPGEVDATTLGRALDVVSRLAGGLSAVRGQLPPTPWEAGMASAWQVVAQHRGLRLQANLLELSGTIGRIGLRAFVDQDGGRWSTVVEGRFPQPLPTPIRAFRDGALFRIARVPGIQDVQVGDPAFDASFVVQGEPASVVRAVLDGETRAALMHLGGAEGADAVVLQERVLVQTPGVLTDPARMIDILDRLTRVMSDIASMVERGMLVQ